MKNQWLKFLVAWLPGLSFLYLLHFAIGGFPTNVFEVLVYLTAVVALATQPSWRKLTRAEVIIGGIVIALSLIAMAVSPDKQVAVGILKGWVVPGLLAAWMLRRVFTDRTAVHTALEGMRAQGVLVAVIGILQQLPVFNIWWARTAPETLQYLDNHRSPSIFNSPDAAAMILVPAFLISVYMAKNRRDYWLTLLISIGLIATVSRGGLITAAMGTLLWYLWKAGKKKISLALFGGTLLVVNPVVLSFIANRHPNSADIRVHIWQKSWEMLMQHPIFGLGLQRFYDAFHAFTLHQVNFDEYITPYAVHPHNILLYTWFLFGLLGLAGLIFGLVRVLLYAYRRTTPQTTIGAVLIMAFIIQGMVDNNLWKNDLIIWFVVSLLLATSRPAPTKG